MLLNKKVKGKKETTVNPEGSVVYDRPKEIQLYLEASNLKITEASFYASAKDKLSSVVKLANECDNDYVMGLAHFLADKGIKLSPVVLLSMLSGKKQSFYKMNLNFIFNTPSRIADAIAMNNLGITHLNPSFKKHVLEAALESMSENTLRKNRLPRRKIKTSDLIKLLRPHPANDKMRELYKAIIENDSSSHLNEKENFLAMKASTKIDEEVKKDMIYEQVLAKKVSTNQLIRNLQYLAEKYNFTKQHELQKSIIEQLKNVRDYRFLNIFDLVQAAIYVPQFEKAIFEIILKFIDDIKKNFIFDKEATFLFDVSGSMDGQGLTNGLRYIAVLGLLFDNVNLRFFSDALVTSEPNSTKIIKALKDGSYQKAKELLHEVFRKYSNGTALIQSTEDLLVEDSGIKNLVVVSDEVSWVEGADLTVRIKDLQKHLLGKKLILINPQVYKGTVFADNVLGIASLTSSILLDFALVTNPMGFVKYIKSYRHKE